MLYSPVTQLTFSSSSPSTTSSQTSTNLKNVFSIIQRLKRTTPELSQIKESELVDAVVLKTSPAMHARQKLLVCLLGKLSQEAGKLLAELMDARRKERVGNGRNVSTKH